MTPTPPKQETSATNKPATVFSKMLGLVLFKKEEELDKMELCDLDKLEELCEAFISEADNLLAPSSLATKTYLDTIKNLINKATGSIFTKDEISKSLFESVLRWGQAPSPAIKGNLLPSALRQRSKETNPGGIKVTFSFKGEFDSSDYSNPIVLADRMEQGEYLAPQQLFYSQNSDKSFLLETMKNAGLSAEAIAGTNKIFRDNLTEQDGLHVKSDIFTLRPVAIHKKTAQATQADLILSVESSSSERTLAVCCTRNQQMRWSILNQGSGHINLGDTYHLLGEDNIIKNPSLRPHQDSYNDNRFKSDAAKPLTVRIFSVVLYDDSSFLEDKLNSGPFFESDNKAYKQELEHILAGKNGILHKYRFDDESNAVSYLFNLQPSEHRKAQSDYINEFVIKMRGEKRRQQEQEESRMPRKKAGNETEDQDLTLFDTEKPPALKYLENCLNDNPRNNKS